MKWADVLFLCFMGAIVGALAGVILGGVLSRAKMQEQAVLRGFASYNPTNGVWQWKEAK